MYHDLLDVLYNVAKPGQIGRGGPPRNGFRGFAKELQIQLIGGKGKLKRLHHLSIPQDEFRDLVKLRLVTHFGGRPNDQIQQDRDLDRVADCIVRAFAQDPNLGITLEMFDQASKTMACPGKPTRVMKKREAELNSRISSLVITVFYHAFTSPTRRISSTGCPNQATSPRFPFSPN